MTSKPKKPIGERILIVLATVVGVTAVAFVVVVLALDYSSRRGVRFKRYKIAMIVELNRLAALEDTVFRTTGRYSDDLSRFTSTQDVSRPTIVVTTHGWTAIVTHAKYPDYSCGIGVGETNPVRPPAYNREPACG